MKDVLRYLCNWSEENKRPFTMQEFLLLINKACRIDLSQIYNKWQFPSNTCANFFYLSLQTLLCQ